jgi:preprotein translocase subunit SecG
VLAKYHIEFRHYSMAIVGALILSKVVLILERVPLGSWVKARPAWVDVLLRTLVYSVGVVLVMMLEKGIEGRHEHGGFGGAVREAFHSAGADHLWANTICVTGALFFYNLLAVIRGHLGEGGLFRLFLRPVPAEANGVETRPT